MIQSLALILEHISHYGAVQPLLFALLAPTVHLLLQILPLCVHAFVYPSQLTPSSRVGLLYTDVLTQLCREIDELLLHLQRDVGRCCCSWHSEEIKGRPPHQQDQETPHQLNRGLPKQVANEYQKPDQRVQHCPDGQGQHEAQRVDIRQQAQQQQNRGGHCRQNSDHYYPLHACSAGDAQGTVFPCRACCGDTPTKTGKSKVSQLRSSHACSSYACCGVCGASPNNQGLQSCQKECFVQVRDTESTATRSSSAIGGSTSCRRSRSRSGSTANATRRCSDSNAFPEHVNTSCNGGIRQSNMCGHASDRYLHFALFTRPQRNNLEGRLRRLRHVVEAAKHQQRVYSEESNKEHPTVCLSRSPGSAANMIRPKSLGTGESPLISNFTCLSANMNSACNSHGKRVRRDTSRGECNPTPSGTGVSEHSDVSHALICNAAAGAIAGTNACDSPSDTSPTVAPFIAPTIRNSAESSPLKTGEEMGQRRSCVDVYGSEKGLTFPPSATNELHNRLPWEASSAAQQTQEQSPSGMRATVLTLLEAGALLPLHSHTLLAFAVRKQQERRRQEQYGQQSHEIPQQQMIAIYRGGLADGTSRSLKEGAETVSVVSGVHIAEKRVQQNRRRKTSLDGGESAVLIPSDGLERRHCTSPTEESVHSRMRLKRGLPLPKSFLSTPLWLRSPPETEHRGKQSVGSNQSMSSVWTADVAISVASSVPVAACSAADRSLLAVEKADVPAVWSDTATITGPPRFARALPWAGTAAAVLGNGVAGSASLGAAVPRAVPLADAANSGVALRRWRPSVCWLKISSSFPSTTLLPTPCATREERAQLQLQSRLTQAAQQTDNSQLHGSCPRTESRPTRSLPQFTGEKRCTSSSVACTESVSSPLELVTAASTSVDSLTFKNQPAVHQSLLGKEGGCHTECSKPSTSTKGSTSKCACTGAITTDSGTLTSRDGIGERASRVASAGDKDSDEETFPLRNEDTGASAPVQCICASLENPYDPEESLPLLWLSGARGEVEQQRILRRLICEAHHETTAATPVASSLAAATPSSLSRFSSSRLLDGEQKCGIIRRLLPATDAKDGAVGQTKKMETPLASRTPRASDKLATLSLAPQDCNQRESDTAAVYREGRAAANDDALWHTKTTTAPKGSNWSCHMKQKSNRTREVCPILPATSRNKSPPLFFSFPEIKLPCSSSEDLVGAPEVDGYGATNKRLGGICVDVDALDNRHVGKSQGPSRRHKAKEDGCQMEGRARRGQVARSCAAAKNTKNKQSKTDKPGEGVENSKTTEHLVCARAEQLIHRMHQACLEVAQLATALQKPCLWCTQRHLLQCVGAPKLVVSPDAENPVIQAFENFVRAVDPASYVSVSPAGGCFSALRAPVEDVLPAVFDNLVSSDVKFSACGASASNVPSMSNATHTADVGAQRKVSRHSPNVLSEGLRKRANADRDLSQNGAQQSAAGAEISAEGLLDYSVCVYSGVSTGNYKENGKELSTALLAVARSKPQAGIATSSTQIEQPSASADAGPKLDSFLCIEESARQRLHQMHREEVCCCPDRAVLFQKRAVCCRTLRTTLQALHQLVSQQCLMLTAYSSNACTRSAGALSFIQRNTQAATSKKLLSLLLRSPLLAQLLPQTICSIRGQQGKENGLGRINRAAKLVQWKQQQHRICDHGGRPSTPFGVRNLRTKVVSSRRTANLKANLFAKISVQSNRGVNCYTDSGIRRATGRIVLRLCGMLLNALCRAVNSASTSCSVYGAGGEAAFCSSYQRVSCTGGQTGMDSAPMEIATTQFPAAPYTGQLSSLKQQLLQCTERETAAHNECSGRSSKRAAAPSSAMKYTPFCGGAEREAGAASQSCRMNGVVFPASGAAGATAAPGHTATHLRCTAEFIADTLLDPCLPLAFTNPVIQLFRPHKEVRLFPHILRRALCGILTGNYRAVPALSASPSAAPSPARTLAISSAESVDVHTCFDGANCRLLSLRKPVLSLPSGKRGVPTLCRAGWLSPLSRTNHSLYNPHTRSSTYAAASRVLRNADSVSFLYEADDKPSFCARLRRAMHSHRLNGTPVSEPAGMQLHNIADNHVPATIDANLSGITSSSSHLPACRVCYTSSHVASNAETLTGCRRKRGLFSLHTEVDFSAPPWTTWLSSAVGAACPTSPVLSRFSVLSCEKFLSAPAAAAGAAPAATSRAASNSPFALVPRPFFLVDGDAAASVFAPARDCWIADGGRPSLVYAFSCAPSSTPETTFCPDVLPSCTPNTFLERPLGTNEAPFLTVCTEPPEGSGVGVPKLNTGGLLLVQVPLLLKKFNINKWINALEKQEQQRLMRDGDKYTLVARVAADLLLHTLQRRRTQVKWGNRAQQNAVPTTQLRRTSGRLPSAPTADSATCGVPAVCSWIPSVSTGAQQVTFLTTAASAASRAAAVPLLFESTDTSEGAGEAVYQLAILTLASYLTSPLMARRQRGASCDSWLCKAYIREQNVKPDCRSMPTLDRTNIIPRSVPTGRALRPLQTPFAENYTLQHRKEAATICTQGGSAAHNRAAESGEESALQLYEGKQPPDGASCCISTCGGHATGHRMLYGATARRVSQRLLLDCVRRLPELLSALLPVALFCVTVHLFHPRFPWQLLRLLFVYVKRRRITYTSTARASASEAGTVPSPTSPRDTPATPEHRNLISLAQCPTASAPGPITKRPAGAAASSASFYADSASALLGGDPRTADVPVKIAVGVGGAPPWQCEQRRRTKQVGHDRVVQALWTQVLTHVAKDQCYCQSCRELSLPQRVSLVHGEASLLLQDSALLLLRRLATLMPSLIVSYRCSRTSHGRDDGAIQNYLFLKSTEWRRARPCLSVAKRLLNKRRIAKRRLHIRTACALFRVLLLRAVEVALNGTDDGSQAQHSGNAAVGSSSIAPQSDRVSRPNDPTAETIIESHSRRSGQNTGNTDTLEGKQATLQKERSLSEETKVAAVKVSRLDGSPETNSATMSAEAKRKERLSGKVNARDAIVAVLQAPVPAALLEGRTTTPTAEAAITVVREEDSVSLVRKPQEPPLSGTRIRHSIETIEDTAPSLDSRVTRTLRRLLVRAAAYAAEECASCSNSGLYRRRHHFMVRLVTENTGSKGTLKWPNCSPDSPFGLRSSRSAQTGGSRVAHRVRTLKAHSFRRYNRGVRRQARLTRGHLQSLVGQHRRCLVISTRERNAHKQRLAFCCKTVGGPQSYDQVPDNCVEGLGKGSTSAEQQLDSRLVVCIAKRHAKSWTRQAAQLIHAAGGRCACGFSGSKRIKNSTGSSGELCTNSQQKPNPHERNTSLERAIGCCDPKKRSQRNSSTKYMHFRVVHSARNRKKKTSTCGGPQESTSTSGITRRRAGQGTRSVDRAHGRQRTFRVGWHLLQTCLQAVRLLPNENQQTLLVCRALCCLTKLPTAKSSAVRTKKKVLLLPCFPSLGRSTIEEERSVCDANLQCLRPFKDRGKPVTTLAAKGVPLAHGASRVRASTATTEADAASTRKVTGRSGVKSAHTTPCTTGVEVDPERKTRAVATALATDISSCVATTPATAAVFDRPSVSRTSRKTAVLLQSATNSCNKVSPMRSFSTGESSAGVAGCQKSKGTIVFSEADSRTRGNGVSLGMQRRRNVEIAREEVERGYGDTGCKGKPGVQDASVLEPQVTEPVRKSIAAYRGKTCIGERALLGCELLLAAFNEQHLVKQKVRLPCDASFANECHQQMSYVNSDEGEVLVERCRAAAALLFLCATTLLPQQYTAPLKHSLTVDWRRNDESKVRGIPKDSPPRTQERFMPKDSCVLLQGHKQASQETITRARETELGGRFARRTGQKGSLKSPTGKGYRGENGTAQKEKTSLSDGGNIYYTRGKIQRKQHFEERQRVSPAELWGSDDASSPGESSVKDVLSLVQQETACGANLMEKSVCSRPPEKEIRRRRTDSKVTYQCAAVPVSVPVFRWPQDNIYRFVSETLLLLQQCWLSRNTCTRSVKTVLGARTTSTEAQQMKSKPYAVGSKKKINRLTRGWAEHSAGENRGHSSFRSDECDATECAAVQQTSLPAFLMIERIPSKMVAASITAALRVAVASYRTALRAATYCVDRSAGVTCKPSKLLLKRLASVHVTKSLCSPPIPCGVKTCKQANPAPQELLGLAAFSGYVTGAEAVATSGRLSTSFEGVGGMLLTADTAEMLFGSTKETSVPLVETNSLCPHSFSKGDEVTDTLKRHASYPSSSSLFYLSSSSSSLGDTPEGRDQSTISLLSHDKAAHRGLETISQVCRISSGTSPLSSACAKDIFGVDTTQTTGAKSNFTEGNIGSLQLQPHDLRQHRKERNLWVEQQEQMENRQLQSNISQQLLQEEVCSSLLRMNNERSTSAFSPDNLATTDNAVSLLSQLCTHVSGARVSAGTQCLHRADITAPLTSPRTPRDQGRPLRETTCRQLLSAQSGSRKHGGEQRTVVDCCTRARTSELVFTALPFSGNCVHSTQQAATVFPDLIHLHAMRVLLTLLTALSYANQMDSFEGVDHSEDDTTSRTDSTCGLNPRTDGRVTRVAEWCSSDAAAIGNYTGIKRRRGDSLLWSKGATCSRGQWDTFNSKHSGRLGAAARENVHYLRQRGLTALASKWFGCRAYLSSEECRMVTQKVKEATRLPEKLVFSVWTERLPSRGRRYVAPNAETSQVSYRRSVGVKGAAPALVTLAAQKHANDLVSHAGAEQTSVQTHEVSSTQSHHSLPLGGFVVDKVTGYLSTSFKDHLRAKDPVKVEYVEGFSLAPCRSKNNDTGRQRDGSTTGCDGVHGFSHTQHPVSTVPLLEQRPSMTCRTKPQEVLPLVKRCSPHASQHTLIEQGRQEQVGPAACIAFLQQAAEKVSKQNSLQRKKVKISCKSSAGVLGCQNVSTPSAICASVEICKDGLRETVCQTLAGSEAVSLFQLCREAVSSDLTETVVLAERSFSFWGRLQNALSTAADLCDHRSRDVHNVQRYKEPVRRKEGRQPEETLKLPRSLVQQLSEAALLECDLSAVRLARPKCMPCTFCGQLLNVARLSDQRTCQKAFTSRHQQTLSQARFPQRGGGAPRLNLPRKTRKVCSLRGRMAGRESQRTTIRKRVSAAYYAKSGYRVSRLKHLLTAALPCRSLVTAWVTERVLPFARKSALYSDPYRGGLLQRVFAHEDNACIAKSMLRAALDKVPEEGSRESTLEANQNGAEYYGCYVIEQSSNSVDPEDEESASKGSPRNAGIKIVRILAGLTATEAVCRTYTSRTRACDLGEQGDVPSRLEHADQVDLWVALLGQNTAGLRKLAELGHQVTNKESVVSAKEYAGPFPCALLNNMMETFGPREYLRCDQPEPRNLNIITTNCSSPGQNPTNGSLRMQRALLPTYVRNGGIEDHTSTTLTDIHPYTHSSLLKAPPRNEMRAAATSAELHVDFERHDRRAEATAATLLCLWNAAHQIQLGWNKAATNSHSPVVTDATRHRVPHVMDNNLLHLCPSEETQVTEGAVPASSLHLCEAEGSVDCHDEIVNKAFRNTQATFSTAWEPKGHIKNPTWTEIESAVRSPQHGSERNYHCYECSLQTEGDSEIFISRGRHRRTCKNCRTACPPPIRCVSTLFESQLSPVARRYPSHMSPFSPEQQTSLHIETNQVSHTTRGALPQYCDALVLLKSLKRCRWSHFGSARLRIVFPTCRASGGPQVVFPRRARALSDSKHEGGRRRRKAVYTSRNSTCPSSRLLRKGRIWSAIVGGRDLNNMRVSSSSKITVVNTDLGYPWKARCVASVRPRTAKAKAGICP